ncbi:hypothetical protein [Granulicella sp. L60]|uniref:hypothetical protein n=1 Tax=Granulicella sp. L60 TaxID=1641866 RepID=UPI00131E6825|nr:hypothetical protein [Granulicella sp. L60]
MKQTDMKQTDEDIDRLLNALRDTEPLDGMQHRILQHTRHHAPQRASWRTLLTPRLEAHPWAIALSCAAILASTIYWTALRPHPAPHELATSKPIAAPITAKELGAPSSELGAPSSATASSSPKVGNRDSDPPSITAPRKNKKPTTPNLTNEHQSSLDQLAAQNHPAPELPLTDQEKLLLRLAHRYDPVEIVALNHPPMASHDAEEKEEVKRFFEPPTTEMTNESKPQ